MLFSICWIGSGVNPEIGLEPIRSSTLARRGFAWCPVVMDPKIWTEKRPFLRWWAALKMKERVNATNPKEPPAQPEGQGRSRGHQGAQDDRPDRADVRRAPDAGRGMEEAGARRLARYLQ